MFYTDLRECNDILEMVVTVYQTKPICSSCSEIYGFCANMVKQVIISIEPHARIDLEICTTGPASFISKRTLEEKGLSGCGFPILRLLTMADGAT